MKKKEIQLPFNIENKVLIHFLQSKVGVVLSNWTIQGMRYMNKYERLYRIILEITMIATSSLLLVRILYKFLAIFISFLTIHTLFWIFNGNFYVLMRYVSKRQNDPVKFISYIKNMYERVNSKPFLLAVVAFGSLSKGGFSASSDFDVRFIRRKGFFNSMRAFTYCALERAMAFLNAFPLDIYVFDMDEIKYKIRSDEPPIVMFDPDGVINDRYRKNKVDFHKFHEMFNETFTGIK
jgi:hypothetical protein